MDLDRFCQMGSRLFHVTFFENWSAIQEHGLMPASWLIKEFVLDEEKQYVSARRSKSTIPLLRDGLLVGLLRDQIPLNRKLLGECLDSDCSVEQWLAKLDERVFFFTRQSDAKSLLMGKAYRNTRRILLEIDRVSLLDAYGSCVEVADINTGVASRIPPSRGHGTFQKLTAYVKKIDSRHITELTIPCGIRDIANHLVAVTLYEPTGETKILPLR